MDNFENTVTETFSDLWHGIMARGHSISYAIPLERVKKMSDIELAIIQMVSENKNIILQDISKKQHIPKSTLTGLINKLENGGYLKRKISTKDLRSYGLELTDEGRQVQMEHHKFEKIFFKKVLEPLTYEDCKILFPLLEKLTKGANIFE
jgi:DNA-binding MarR family transcriptional regulator